MEAKLPGEDGVGKEEWWGDRMTEEDIEVDIEDCLGDAKVLALEEVLERRLKRIKRCENAFEKDDIAI